MTSLEVLFVGAWLLLAVGFYVLMLAHDLIRAIIALQLMMKAAMLVLVVAGVSTGQTALGQSLAITAIVVDTIAIVIGLALVIVIKARLGTLDLGKIINVEDRGLL